MDLATGAADAAGNGILQASSSVLDYVRMSNLVVKKARQGSPLQQIAKAIATQPHARNAYELKMPARSPMPTAHRPPLPGSHATSATNSMVTLTPATSFATVNESSSGADAPQSNLPSWLRQVKEVRSGKGRDPSPVRREGAQRRSSVMNTFSVLHHEPSIADTVFMTESEVFHDHHPAAAQRFTAEQSDASAFHGLVHSQSDSRLADAHSTRRRRSLSVPLSMFKAPAAHVVQLHVEPFAAEASLLSAETHLKKSFSVVDAAPASRADVVSNYLPLRNPQLHVSKELQRKVPPNSRQHAGKNLTPMQSLQKKLVTSPVLAVDAPAKAATAPLKRGHSVESMAQAHTGPQTDRQRMASIAKLKQHLVRMEAESVKPKPAPHSAPAKRASVEVQAAFNVNSQAQVFYGSVVAFESLDGWFLCLHPRSGVVSVREPDAHWAEKGVMPFRKSKSLGGSSKEPPVFLFKLIHLANPMYNGPVRFGDPVWFQIFQGRGEDGWTTGSILAPYMQKGINLDSAAVDISGGASTRFQAAHAASQDDRIRRALEAASASNTLFGLPTKTAGSPGLGGSPGPAQLEHLAPAQAAAALRARLQKSIQDNSAASLKEFEMPHAGFGSSQIVPQEVRRELSFIPPEGTSNFEVFPTLAGAAHEGVGVERSHHHVSTMLSPRASGQPHLFLTADDVEDTDDHLSANPAFVKKYLQSPLPKAKPLDPHQFVKYLHTEVESNARLNPLDRLKGRLGFPRPIVAHVPAFGGSQDFLFGPATTVNKQGIYRRLDPGYDVLYELANARPITAGKWRLQLAVKELTEDGYIIGGMGVEGPADETNSGFRVRKTHATVNFEQKQRGGRHSSNRFSDATLDKVGNKAAGYLGDTMISVDEPDRTKQKTDGNDLVQPFLLNSSELYIEQEWFYIAYSPAEATAPSILYEQGLDHSELMDTSHLMEDHNGDGSRPMVNVSKLPPTEAMKAADSTAFLKQRPDGASGGNRRHAFLQAHGSSSSATYKVEKKGVFRLRLLQTDEVTAAVALAKQDQLTLRAQDQLAGSAKIRLGASAIGMLTSSVGQDSKGIPDLAMIDSVDMTDPSAASNMARHLKGARRDAQHSSGMRYLAYEAAKFNSPHIFYGRKIEEVLEDAKATNKHLRSNAVSSFLRTTRDRPSLALTRTSSLGNTRSTLSLLDHGAPEEAVDACALCRKVHGNSAFAVDLCTTAHNVMSELASLHTPAGTVQSGLASTTHSMEALSPFPLSPAGAHQGKKFRFGEVVNTPNLVDSMALQWEEEFATPARFERSIAGQTSEMQAVIEFDTQQNSSAARRRVLQRPSAPKM